MYILDRGSLRKGDIIFTRENTVRSKAVKYFTDGDYSHALLYVADGSYIHSDGNGVHSGNIQRMLFEGKDNVAVARIVEQKYVAEAIVYARAQIGKLYSIKQAASVKLKALRNVENRQFCSRLVAQAFSGAGCNLVADPDYCSPQEIFDSDMLEKVNEIIRPATQTEVEYSKSDNLIERQALITNRIFKDVRDLTGRDIQTFSDIAQFVIDNKEFDGDISNIFQNSGYLDLWKDEAIKNPWRYDSAIFSKQPLSTIDLKKLANDELDSANEMMLLYKKNYDMYLPAARLGLRFIEQQIKHYYWLIEQTKRRAAASLEVISTQQHCGK